MTDKPFLWIMGGSSKLGQSIAIKLFDTYQVISFSRSGEKKNKGLKKNIEMDLSQLSMINEVIDPALDEMAPTGIVFVQRYRVPKDNNYDVVEAFKTEIFSTQSVIEKIISNKASTQTSIVIISSMYATLIDPFTPVEYHLLKAAQLQLVKYFSVAVNDAVIRINGIAPGTFIKTDINNYPKEYVDRLQRIRKVTPTNSNTSSLDIVNLIEFLISETSGQINGQIFNLDGGLGNRFQETLI